MTYVIRTVRLRGVSPGLDGIKARVREHDSLYPDDLVEVVWLNGAIVADGTLFISRDGVEDSLPDLSEDEQETTNPYGGFVRQGRWADPHHELTYAVYERATTVNVRHIGTGKTSYSEVFYGPESAEAILEISRMECIPGLEPVDFVFTGRNIKRGA